VVGLDSPTQLLAELGEEILELRVESDAPAAIAALRASGVASADAFSIGSTLTVPLHGRTVQDALAALNGFRTSDVSSRVPTLDDVYLRLTGDRIPEAA
jgi:hypothetical protein